MNSKTFLTKQTELNDQFILLKSKYEKGELSIEELEIRKKELQNQLKSFKKMRTEYEGKQRIKWIIGAILFTVILFGVLLQMGNENVKEYNKPKDPYEMLHVAFEGYPDKVQIKKLLEPVMQEHNFPVTDENILKAGNSLATLHDASAIGITEMEILKHAYQNSIKGATLGEQFGFSAAILEKTK